jgi:hypothetical protein
VVGLVRSLDKPLKILGGGDVTGPLFVIADAFTKSAREKIEAAGGSAQLLEIPSSPLAALGVGSSATADEPATADGSAVGDDRPTANGSAVGDDRPTANGA